MSYLTVSTEDKRRSPFVIARYQLPGRGDAFTPEARLVIEPTLRDSGMLQSLSDEASRTLLALLAFVTPNGLLRPAIPQVAAAMGTTEQAARERVCRLAQVVWRGELLVMLQRAESGMETVTVSPLVVSALDTEGPLRQGEEVSLQLPYGMEGNQEAPSVRERIIENSRAHYARPRAEVERMVMEQLGYSPEQADDTPEGAAHRKLSALGVLPEEADLLVKEYGVDAVLRQVEWLPYRQARNPARYLVAAIQGNYEPPASVLVGDAVHRLEEKRGMRQTNLPPKGVERES